MMNRATASRRVAALACVLLLAAAGMSAAPAAGMARSAAKVDAVVTDAAGDQATTAVHIRLAIADGWHVNAHPASLDFLVPTSIQATANGATVPVNVDWPAGHDSGIELGGTAIEVYGDGVVIPVFLDRSTADAQPTLNVRVQACSDQGLCLAPSTLRVPLQQS